MVYDDQITQTSSISSISLTPLSSVTQSTPTNQSITLTTSIDQTPLVLPTSSATFAFKWTSAYQTFSLPCACFTFDTPINYTLMNSSSFVLKTNTFSSSLQTLYIKMDEISFDSSLIVEFESFVRINYNQISYDTHFKVIVFNCSDTCATCTKFDLELKQGICEECSKGYYLVGSTCLPLPTKDSDKNDNLRLTSSGSLVIFILTLIGTAFLILAYLSNTPTLGPIFFLLVHQQQLLKAMVLIGEVKNQYIADLL